MSRARGIDRERRVAFSLRADGWTVVRAAGSLGVADLVAGKEGRTMLVEVKSTAQGPWEGFGPKDRLALLDAAHGAGWEPWLVWWPARGVETWIGAEEWPENRGAVVSLDRYRTGKGPNGTGE